MILLGRFPTERAALDAIHADAVYHIETEPDGAIAVYALEPAELIGPPIGDSDAEHLN